MSVTPGGLRSQEIGVGSCESGVRRRELEIIAAKASLNLMITWIHNAPMNTFYLVYSF